MDSYLVIRNGSIRFKLPVDSADIREGKLWSKVLAEPTPVLDAEAMKRDGKTAEVTDLYTSGQFDKIDDKYILAVGITGSAEVILESEYEAP